jgi:site-specific recombinase XerD
MFDRLFRKPFVLARHQNGPLADERRRYLAHCAEQRLSWRTLQAIALYTLVIAEALQMAERPGEYITRTEIEAEADRWFNRRSAPAGTPKNRHLLKIYFTNHVARWLTFLGRLKVAATVQHPYANHVAEFANSVRERGLSPQTVAYYSRAINQFLAQIKDGRVLKSLTVVQVDELLANKVADEGYARSTIQRWSSVLSLFFRFAEERGWCRKGLAAAIMAPRVFAHESLPVGPSWDDVKRLLAAAKGDRPVDIRDRALLMLLAVYGLRAGEVAALRLQDFDWEREVLNVPHSKSQRPRTYPLCRPVGDAVIRYLREVRPESERREVFLILVAPFRPLVAKALGRVVERRLHALGLTLPRYGPHVLRHACATHLLSQGLSLKEIGDHLGHQSPETTRIYAKVDLAALRTVADFNLEGLL